MGTLRRVLLATDLSARGDRALERAVAVAQRHDAQLLILHVFEELDESTRTYATRALPSWRRPPDAAARMKQRVLQGLRADLGDAAAQATVLIEEGDPAEVIERVAIAEQVELVITGIAREGPLSSRPVVLGRTVEQLLRRLPAPILIVKDRARDAYQHVVVATDFSEASAHALQMALRVLPGQTLYLLHASELPYPTLVSDLNRHEQSYREIREGELQRFLSWVFVPEADRQRLVPVIESGKPRQIIREYVQLHGADLVVLGTRGRGAVMEALLGSTAKDILSALPCDALVVRGPG